MIALSPPSPLLTEHRGALREAARSGPILDLACGRGRHALAAAADGARVIAMDRDAAFLAELRQRAGLARERVHGVRADLESPPIIPLRANTCGAVLVFRFLFRPLAPQIVEVLKPGGLLLYETFTTGQRALPGGPRNPAFLLAPGELRQLFRDLDVVTCWEGVTAGDSPSALARLVARKPGALGAADRSGGRRG